MTEQSNSPNLTSLESLILQLGYSKNVAATVIDFLRSQTKESIIQEDLEAIFEEVQDFVKQILKPQYQAKSIDRVFALIDITVEMRETDIYFIKHLFDPEQEDARLHLEYALMRRLAEDSYILAMLERGRPEISLQHLTLKGCFNVFEKDLRFAPSSRA